MVSRCDFFEQESKDIESGKLRPDMIIKLPEDREIVVDAKTSLDAYLDAQEEEDSEKIEFCLDHHAKQVRNHMKQLSRKSYWDSFDKAPEFVVMFIPGEAFLSAAVERDPTLIEDGMNSNVIVATPSTFISLMKVISYGWKQFEITQNAEEIRDLGKELYDRISTLAEHFENVGKHLEKSMDYYNKTITTLESRVLVTTRRFKELGISTKKEIPETRTILYKYN
jgi:DNA recombination protein RmuC